MSHWTRELTIVFTRHMIACTTKPLATKCTLITHHVMSLSILKKAKIQQWEGSSVIFTSGAKLIMITISNSIHMVVPEEILAACT
jgi:hypothetical protein